MSSLFHLICFKLCFTVLDCISLKVLNKYNYSLSILQNLFNETVLLLLIMLGVMQGVIAWRHACESAITHYATCSATSLLRLHFSSYPYAHHVDYPVKLLNIEK